MAGGSAPFRRAMRHRRLAMTPNPNRRSRRLSSVYASISGKQTLIRPPKGLSQTFSKSDGKNERLDEALA